MISVQLPDPEVMDWARKTAAAGISPLCELQKVAAIQVRLEETTREPVPGGPLWRFPVWYPGKAEPVYIVAYLDFSRLETRRR